VILGVKKDHELGGGMQNKEILFFENKSNFLKFSLFSFFSLIFLNSGMSLLSIFPMRYTWSELLINYQGGICRRGLLGEVAYHLQDFVRADYFLIVTQVSLYLVFLALLLFSQKKFNYAFLLFLFSPATIVFPVTNFPAFARKDIEILFVFLLALLLVKKCKPSKILTALLILLYLGAGLIVESSIFYFPLAFSAMMVKEAPTSSAIQLKRWALAILFMSFFILLMTWLKTLNPDPSTGIVASWSYYYQNVGVIKHNALGFLKMSLSDAVSHTIQYVLKPKVILGYSVASMLANIPLLYFLSQNIIRFSSGIVTAGVICSFLVMLGSFIFMADWGRCIYLMTTHSFLFFLFVSKPKKVHESLSGCNYNQAFWSVVLRYSLLFLYALSWRVLYFVNNRESPLKLGLLFDLIN
jgi:hypothetical protein